MLVAALAGCGGSDKPDSEQIQSLARSWAGNLHNKKWNEVCKDFSAGAHAQIRQVAQQLQVTSCMEVMQAAFGRTGAPLQNVSPDSVKVTNIKVNGAHATADVSPSADRNPMTYFVKEKGDWKIDADPQSNTTTGAGGSGSTPSTPGSG